MPYIIGVHSSLKERVMREDIQDAIVLDLDSNELIDEHNDRQKLPSEAVSSSAQMLSLYLLQGVF